MPCVSAWAGATGKSSEGVVVKGGSGPWETICFPHQLQSWFADHGSRPMMLCETCVKPKACDCMPPMLPKTECAIAGACVAALGGGVVGRDDWVHLSFPDFATSRLRGGGCAMMTLSENGERGGPNALCSSCLTHEVPEAQNESAVPKGCAE